MHPNTLGMQKAWQTRRHALDVTALFSHHQIRNCDYYSTMGVGLDFRLWKVFIVPSSSLQLSPIPILLNTHFGYKKGHVCSLRPDSHSVCNPHSSLYSDTSAVPRSELASALSLARFQREYRLQWTRSSHKNINNLSEPYSGLQSTSGMTSLLVPKIHTCKTALYCIP